MHKTAKLCSWLWITVSRCQTFRAPQSEPSCCSPNCWNSRKNVIRYCTSFRPRLQGRTLSSASSWALYERASCVRLHSWHIPADWWARLQASLKSHCASGVRTSLDKIVSKDGKMVLQHHRRANFYSLCNCGLLSLPETVPATILWNIVMMGIVRQHVWFSLVHGSIIGHVQFCRSFLLRSKWTTAFFRFPFQLLRSYVVTVCCPYFYFLMA